jgi:hypothetical protein
MLRFGESWLRIRMQRVDESQILSRERARDDCEC